jgi:hypothetical protein
MMLSLFRIQWPPLSPILLALAQYSSRASSTIPSQWGTAGNYNAIQDLESLKFVLIKFVLWLEAPFLTIWACRCRGNILTKGLLKQLMPLALPGSANYFFNWQSVSDPKKNTFTSKPQDLGTWNLRWRVYYQRGYPV